MSTEYGVKKVLEVQSIIHNFVNIASLDEQVGAGEEAGDFTLADTIADSRDYFAEFESKEAMIRLLIILRERLSPREYGVITKYFGLDTGEAMTLDAVGKIYGVTRERIRQVVAKALRKVRMYCNKNQLSEEDFT